VGGVGEWGYRGLAFPLSEVKIYFIR